MQELDYFIKLACLANLLFALWIIDDCLVSNIDFNRVDTVLFKQPHFKPQQHQHRNERGSVCAQSLAHFHKTITQIII